MSFLAPLARVALGAVTEAAAAGGAAAGGEAAAAGGGMLSRVGGVAKSAIKSMPMSRPNGGSGGGQRSQNFQQGSASSDPYGSFSN